MINFPLTVIDNFLENPDKVRNFALQQEFFKDERNKYPGTRTKPLYEIDPFFCNELLKKVFSIYYDFNNEALSWNADIFFQSIDSLYNEGWVHQDSNKVTGILYLNPNANLQTGTSLYKAKKNVLNANIDLFNDKKQSFFRGDISCEESEIHRKKNNEQFEETVNVSNVYNRLVFFDANQYHSAQSFSNDSKEQRLTLIFFIHSVFAKKTPLEKSKFYII